MQLSEFVGYRDGKRWTSSLSSAAGTVFLADVTERLQPDDMGSNGFGPGDAVAALSQTRLDVTLFLSNSDEWPWAWGVLVTSGATDVTGHGWMPLPEWDGSPFRFCVDSGVVVIAGAEAFDDVLRLRNTAGSFDLAETIASGKDPVQEGDRIYFNADANCYGCWVFGEPGSYEALYVDMYAE